MILFLRNQKNETIVDLEVYVKTEDDNKFIEVSSSIIIDTYSQFLLDNINRAKVIIKDFSNISELRGWLWEVYFNGGDNNPDKYDDVLKTLRSYFNKIADKYNLIYVED